jgi:predicted transcriptional regulator
MPVGVVTREQAYMGAADANSNLIVMEICVKEFESIGQDEYAYDALRRMSLSDVSFVVVTGDGGTVVGYLSRGDLVRALKPKIEDETLIE